MSFVWDPASRKWLAWVAAASITASFAAAVLAFDRSLRNIDDPILRAALAFTSAQSATVVLLVVGLITGKYVQNRRERTRAGPRSALADLLSRDGELEAAIDAADRWPDEFLAVAQDALRLFSGEERNRVEIVLRRSRWYPLLLRDAALADPLRAARAVRVLGELSGEECSRAVENALAHGSSQVRFAARRAILANGPVDGKLDVLRSLPQVALWERIVLFHSIPTDSLALARFLEEAFQRGQEPLALIALELLYSVRRLVPLTIPPDLARADNSEVRIRFYKALPYCATRRDLSESLREGLHDADWRVRAMAAQACASLRPESIAGDLLAMCQSFSNAAEAAHAARALSALGGEARRRLQGLAASGSVATRQIAAEVLERQLLHSTGVRS